MKYHILIPITVEAEPADLGGAARKGFKALADMVNDRKLITIHMLPQDGSTEAVLAQKVLDCCFTATSKPSM